MSQLSEDPTFLARHRRRFEEHPRWRQFLEVMALICTIVGLPVAIVVAVLESNSNSKGQPSAAPAVASGSIEATPAPTPTSTAQVLVTQPEQIKCGIPPVLGRTRGADYFEEASCGGALVPGATKFRGRWFALLGDGSLVTLSTCNGYSGTGDAYDTRIRVYRDAAPGGGRECTAGNDDDEACAHGGRFSTVSFAADRGATYLVLVDGRQAEGGEFLMSIECQPPLASSPPEATADPANSPTGPPFPRPTSQPAPFVQITPTRRPTPRPTSRPTSGATAECAAKEALFAKGEDGAPSAPPPKNFGIAVAVSGNVAVVGSTGAAYVFARGTDRTWRQEARLLPVDGGVGDGSSFGGYRKVAISAGTVVVGAPGDDDHGGAAYVFVRADGGRWEQQAKLLPGDDAVAYEVFGYSVAVEGDMAVVGASGGFGGSGSATVFSRSGGTWSEEARLVPSDGVGDDRFAESVAISAGSIVVGAWGHKRNGRRSGAAYVFDRSGGAWEEMARLLAKDGTMYDNFGIDVGISGDTIVVGSYGDSNENGDDSGAVYIFGRSGSAWTENAKILGEKSDDRFGRQVAISGDVVVIGARQSWSGEDAIGTGYVSILIRKGSTWVQQTKLTPDEGSIGDWFGWSVSIDGRTIIIGARTDDVNSANGAKIGAAYMIDLC